MTRAPRTVVGLTTFVALALSVSACAPETHELPTPTPTATTSPTASPEPDPTPTETVEPGYPGAPIIATCDQIVTDQAIYDWGSGNFAADPAYAPAPWSDAAAAVAAGGLACGWINLTSGETLTVAVADLSTDALGAAKATAVASGAAFDLGPEFDGYFTASGGIGHVDAFIGNYWITAQSAWFSAPEDASPIVGFVPEALH